MTSRHPSPSPAAPPLEDDNLLSEILLRLPPQPSSLPRASLVSKRWLRLVSDPGFFRRFRHRHRHNPPLLGFFNDSRFVPTMDPPNRVPDGRFSSPLDLDGARFFLGSRHGLLLIFDAPMRPPQKTPLSSRRPVLVWDPVSGDQHRIAVPPAFDTSTTSWITGALLRRTGSVHFQVVLVLADEDVQKRPVLAWVYSSETGKWGDPISMLLPPMSAPFLVYACKPAVLAGDSLHWLLIGTSLGILEFDLDRQTLAMVPVPPPVHMLLEGQYSVLRTDGGGLGFLFVSGYNAQLWNRRTDSDGVASWVLERTVELDKLLSLKKQVFIMMILGVAEYNNVVLLVTDVGLFMIQLESLQFKKLPRPSQPFRHHAFESVYAAGMALVELNFCTIHKMIVPIDMLSSCIEYVHGDAEMASWVLAPPFCLPVEIGPQCYNVTCTGERGDVDC